MDYDLEIFLFIDAMGWEIVQRTEFLKDLLPHRRRIEMQFGYSSAAIPTILSGTTPAVHGHLGLFRFAAQESQFRRLASLARMLRPASFWNRGRIRHWLSKLVARSCGITGYFELYQVPFERLPMMEYCETRDLFVQGGMGEVANLADFLAPLGVNWHISNWRLGDRRNFLAAREAIRQGAQFLFVYTAELDSLLHRNPQFPLDQTILQKLEWYRLQILQTLDACKTAHRRVRLTVVSDHGMSPLRQTVDLKSAVEATGLVFGKDYGVCYDSTMCRVTFLAPGAEDVIRQALQPFAAFGHWLSREEEEKYGIYRADRYFGDAIFLLNPGVQIAPSDMGAGALPGMHGYAPEDRDSYACALSNAELPGWLCHVSDYFALMRERAAGLKAN